MQTVLYYVLENLEKALAPILPHLAEDIFEKKPYNHNKDASVFEGVWPTEQFDEVGTDDWAKVREVREDVNKCLDLARSAKAIGASLDAGVVIFCDDDATENLLKKLNHPGNEVDELKYLWLISQVKIVRGDGSDNYNESNNNDNGKSWFLSKSNGVSGCAILVTKAAGSKCNRCWYFDENVGTGREKDLCTRCDNVVAAIGGRE